MTRTIQKQTQQIMQHYHPGVVKKWKVGLTKELQLDFDTYLRWIIDTPNEKLNEHFAPIIEMAQPCRIQYNFYGNFDTYSSDLDAIIKKLDLPKDMFVGRAYHSTGTETKDNIYERLLFHRTT